MSNNKNLQYQQNIDIVKNFFRKPIVLVVGILTLIATLCQSVVSYIMAPTIAQTFSQHMVDLFGDFSSFVEEYESIIDFDLSTEPTFSLDLFAIALGIAFILLFAHGRSKSNSIQGSAKYFKVLATIEYVVSFVVAIFAILVVIITLASDFPAEFKINISMIVIAIGALVFLAGYGKMRFAQSVCESMNSIYLEKSGTTLFAVTSIIKGAVAALAFSGLVGMAVIGAIAFDGLDVPWLFTYPLVTILYAINNICMSIMALKYAGYINGIENGSLAMPVVKADEAIQEDNDMVCSNCGNPLTEEDVFCSVCGNKVQ